jgi:selenocysteine lyase/cysteine desulfurase
VNIRGLFAGLVGAEPGEIALVNNTKAGEQLVLDRLEGLPDGNIVTDDLHFSGSLHNYEGLRRAGWGVRVARAVDWRVPTEAIAALVDDDTRLIAVSHVSNVNGHIADLPALADLAHAHGAYLYADIIQSAGVLPMDLSESGVDFAACNGYKWLYGTHGSGFLYVRKDRQGSALVDRVFPGRAQLRYPPWAEASREGESPVGISPREDASRYETGHHSYIGYAALYEGLKFVDSVGVEAMHAATVGLIGRLLERIDLDRYPSMSTHIDRSPIVSFHMPNAPSLSEPLKEAGVVVTLAPNFVRVSPAIYNTTEDIDLLADALNNV